MKLNLSLPDKLLKEVREFAKDHPEWNSIQDGIRTLIAEGLKRYKEEKKAK